MGRGGKNKRRREEEDEDEDEEMAEKLRRVSKFLDIDAEEADSDEDFEFHDGDDDDDNDGFFVDGAEPGEISRRSPLWVSRDEDDDEEEDVEAMEKMVKERYSRTAREYDDDFDEETTIEEEFLQPSVYGAKLWMVKCLPGHEKEVAASLMQKSKEKGSRILSAISLDHLRNYIYVKAYKEADVKEACKGMLDIFSQNITMVPLKEMRYVLSDERRRPDINVSKGDWVRLKRSNYKGSLAKVVDVDDVALTVTVKVAPKLSSLSLDDKLDGINSICKTVALSSVTTNDLKPSIEEVENFRETGEADEDLATLFKGKHHECWVKGDTVMVVKGELKNLSGSVEFVDGDLVHFKPNVKIPMKTVTVRKTDLVKHFEPGCQVKVINGVHEGATGMVVKVDQYKLTILSDASKNQITVLAGQVTKSKEISESNSACASHENRERAHNSSASRPPPGPCPYSAGRGGVRVAGRGAGQFGKRHDSMLGKNVKITQGSYRGYRGCIKGVNGHSIRVELEAQMKIITVDRSHISDNSVLSSTTRRIQERMLGSETPLPPQTPMHSMGGETPWRTPGPSTPIHHGCASPSCKRWNPFSFEKPTRLTPTP